RSAPLTTIRRGAETKDSSLLYPKRRAVISYSPSVTPYMANPSPSLERMTFELPRVTPAVGLESVTLIPPYGEDGSPAPVTEPLTTCPESRGWRMSMPPVSPPLVTDTSAAVSRGPDG